MSTPSQYAGIVPQGPRGVNNLGILFGVAVCATLVAFRAEFAFDRPTVRGYAGLAVLFTLAMILFYWLQEGAGQTMTRTGQLC